MRGVPMSARRGVFVSTVDAEGLSGMDAVVLAKQETNRLEVVRMQLMRKLAGERGINLTEGGERRQKSSAEGRRPSGYPLTCRFCGIGGCGGWRR